MVMHTQVQKTRNNLFPILSISNYFLIILFDGRGHCLILRDMESERGTSSKRNGLWFTYS